MEAKKVKGEFALDISNSYHALREEKEVLSSKENRNRKKCVGEKWADSMKYRTKSAAIV